jgi:iron complex transport system substrate-binding protein
MKFTVLILLLIGLITIIGVTSAEEVQIGGPVVVPIMGNANQDQLVNQDDITYLKGVIAGTNQKNDLCDANNDGTIDQADIDQVQKIIDGTEGTIFYRNLNNEVASVKHPLNNIIVVYDNTAEIIRILGAQDKVVGVDSMIAEEPMYFPELSKVSSIGERKDCNIEKILELKPDAVFIHAKSDSGCPDLEEKLKGKGIDVVRLGTWESHTAVPSLMAMAYMLDKVDNATKYIQYQEKYLDQVKERAATIPDEKKVQVFVDRPGDTTVSKGSGYSEVVEYAGGKNIGRDISGGFENVLPKVDTEWVVKENPDAIIALSWKGGYETDDMNTLKDRYAEVVAKPGFSSTNAVKNKRVYITPYINVLGPGYHIGLLQFAKWLYPDEYKDVDIQKIQDEYIKNWQHTTYDLKNHGVFGYDGS